MEPLRISLKAARINANLTAKEAGQTIDKTEKTVLNWENGKTPITAEYFYKLCKLYNIDSDYVQVPSVNNDDNNFFYDETTV